jgi:hypothetical protein
MIVYLLFTAVCVVVDSMTSPTRWDADLPFLSVTNGDCDFPKLDAHTAEAETALQLKVPFIIRNAIAGWPAFVNWEKNNLLSSYGNRVVRSGSESSIVHSGGVAEHESTLADMVESMRRIDHDPQDTSFIFDTTILRVIPELNKDFKVPPFFRSWDNTKNESTNSMWHMLSLGPSKCGRFFCLLSWDELMTWFLLGPNTCRSSFPQPRQDMAGCGPWNQAVVRLPSRL